MRAPDAPVLRDIVLVGGGHSHAVLLRMWAMRPEPGVRLTLICGDSHTPYSGMLPGYVAGHYDYDEVHIDLRKLCASAGARFIRADVNGIDRSDRRVRCAGRPAMPYDLLSINIGATPMAREVPGAMEHAIPVKPIRAFNDRWLALLDRVRSGRGTSADAPLRIAVVGGGAGGVELLLAMQWRLSRELAGMGRDPAALDFVLLTAGPDILPTHNAGVRRRFTRALADRRVEIVADADVDRVEPGRLHTRGGRVVDADEIVWVTRAAGAPWLRETGLALDDRGFVVVDACLRSVTDPLVFAAGDIASFRERPLEKAGVFAVRQGRPLDRNLRAAVHGRAPTPWRPQRTWLALISTGGRHAVASRGSLIGFDGAWVWRWKDWIDRRFMRRLSDLPKMADAGPPSTGPGPSIALNAEESRQAVSAIAMRCGGCGAKVGQGVLSRALGGLVPVDRDDVLIGLHAPDDAAVIRIPPGKAVVQTVDFFRAFVDDPYVFGRIAANHALGDVFAMGGEAQSATAIVTVPPGLEAKVEDVLFQMMSGAVEILNEAGCALVGGHTGEGRELALGFAINGLIEDAEHAAMRKGGMRPGDLLVLTKPIGTGTLFAALPLGRARGRWIDAALESMQVSNRVGAKCLMDHGATACTDLTGFGLLGHLVEMTRPSGVDAELDLAALPLLPGAEECVAAGILSSLQPENLRLRRAIRNQDATVSHPRYPLIFDPQTAGGLLASVPNASADACLAALRHAGYPHAAIIGRVLPQADALEPIVLVP